MNAFLAALSALVEFVKLARVWMERDVKLQTERLTHEKDLLHDEIVRLADDPSPNNELRIETLNSRIVRKNELLRSLRPANG